MIIDPLWITCANAHSLKHVPRPVPISQPTPPQPSEPVSEIVDEAVSQEVGANQ